MAERKRFTRTGRHFTRRDCADEVSLAGHALELRPWRRNRLCVYGSPKETLDPAELATFLSMRPRTATVLIDSSFVDEKTDPRLWAALLDRARGITIIPAVGVELVDWLERHHAHPLAQAIHLGDPSVETWQLNHGPHVDPAVYLYYVHLLAMRKRMFTAVEAELRDLVKSASATIRPEDVFRTIQQRYGERGELMARKGLAGVGRPNRYTDEKVVGAAVLHAVMTGKPTCILTKDEDLQEQFYKLCWLLDMQYRGFLLGRLYSKQPEAYQTRPWSVRSSLDAFAFFEPGEHLLLETQSAHLQEVLPELFNSVELHCIVAGVHHSRLSFNAEREMSGLLDAKARTGGLNTDALDGRNCHVWVPAPSNAPHGYAAIGYDLRLALPNSKAFMSVMDVNHVSQTDDRFGAQRAV
jgi:hypothetical protein